MPWFQSKIKSVAGKKEAPRPRLGDGSSFSESYIKYLRDKSNRDEARLKKGHIRGCTCDCPPPLSPEDTQKLIDEIAMRDD